MTVMSEALSLRPVTPDEFDPLYDLVLTAFHGTDRAEDRDEERAIFEAERTVGIFDGPAMVATAGAYSRDMTLPGGPVPVACVTGVAVAPAYTRQGLLTRMMRHQLSELYEQGGEPVAALWASESAIYGRYGYGMAARHARLTADLRLLRLPGSPTSRDRRIRAGEATDPALRGEIATVYDRVRTETVGYCDRRGAWWNHRLYDPEHDRGGATPLRVAVHDGPGGPDGYVVFTVAPEWQEEGPAGSVRVRELCAETPAAHTALWSFVFALDLVTDLTYGIAPIDSALLHLVDYPRRLNLRPMENLWVRLVDVGRALAGRSYSTPVDVVLDVSDAFCPWNAGRWRLEGGPDGATCARTDNPADLALTSTELGAAHLGGTTLDALARAGRVREERPGALRAAAVAFAEPRAPFCPEIF